MPLNRDPLREPLAFAPGLNFSNCVKSRPFKWNVQDLLGVDQAGFRRRSSLNRYGGGSNLDGGRLFCHFQFQRDSGNPAGIHHDAGYVNRVEARLGDGHIIFAEREILKNELTC